MPSQNELAQTFKSYHKPGDPIVLTNVWDAITAQAIAALPETRALATASYAIAAAAGLEDADLTLDANLHAVRGIAKVAAAAGKPLTVDFQDGFGEKLEAGIKSLLDLGVVGINLEDFSREADGLYSIPDAQARIKKVLEVAAAHGVPDFVVNARTDALVTGLSIDEAITRGKAYLEAGATTTFIWGGRARGGTRTEEVEKAARELGGRLNVSFVIVREGALSVEELKAIGGTGVARLSVGPQLMLKTTGLVAEAARKVYGVGKA